MKYSWIRRRWQDFRFGHSFYLVFAMSFANFILIFHRLLIERVDMLNDVFSNLWVFTVFFIIIYVPVAIAVGVFHRRTQIKIESEQTLLNNPFMARNFRVLVDMLEGKASKEEIAKFRKLLLQIEEKGQYK